MKNIFVVILAGFLISSCGTLSTLQDGPLLLANEKYMGSQPCDKIGRIYSGVRYDYCIVFLGDGSDWELEGYLVWDFPFSFVLDTVILPYSIYRQVTAGDLEQSRTINGN